MSPSPAAIGPAERPTPLQAFSGSIERTKTGPLYSLGLGVVAFAMVLLPLIYLAIITLTAWAVLLHLTYDTWVFNGSGNAVIRLILYLGPAVAGGILVFFMVKPFFAAKPKAPDLITLDPAKEPLLFAFVQKVCGLVGATVPSRIQVDCEVNASASLRRGLWSKELILTVGLPLVSGLDMRQFAGVLAHEFGHFAQGAGMRFTYIIRRINFWFARVVYERDAWDLKLERAAKGSDWRIGVVLHMARGCVWLSRRILWALMHVGNAISCFMLRQMEFDADSYEAKLAGSDAFESTASRLRLLNAATHTAYEDVRQSWASNRLPENLPLLINHKAGSLPEAVQQKLLSSAAAEKTGWFDTHPCDADRIQAARRLKQSGVFRLTEPAPSLFTDFAELSKRVTRHQYENRLQLEFTEQNLVSAEDMLRESAASVQTAALVRKYYGKVDLSLKPLLLAGELPPIAPTEDPVKAWRAACRETEALRAEAEKVSAQCEEHQKRLVDLTSAHRLTRAGFKVEQKAFGLPETAATAKNQEIAARFALEETKKASASSLAALEPFMAALRRRVTLALRLARAGQDSLSPGDRLELAEIVPLLAAVAAELPRAHEMGSCLPGFVLLGQNRANHSRPADVDAAAGELAAELQTLLKAIQEHLAPFAYPFPHARGRLTVAEYARFEKPADHELQRVFQDANAHVNRLFPLHYQLLGRILVHVEVAETSLEKQ